MKAKKNSTQTSLVAVKNQLYDLIAYAEYAVKYTETLIIPEVEIQFMFSRFLVQLLAEYSPVQLPVSLHVEGFTLQYFSTKLR